MNEIKSDFLKKVNDNKFLKEILDENSQIKDNVFIGIHAISILIKVN